jgi:hypothetical protein
MTFADILTLPEGKILEFKRDTSSLKQIMRRAKGGSVRGRGCLLTVRHDRN